MEHILYLFGFGERKETDLNIRVANVRKLSERVSELLSKKPDLTKTITKTLGKHGNH